MLKRLLKRSETSGREDDNEESIKKRFREPFPFHPVSSKQLISPKAFTRIPLCRSLSIMKSCVRLLRSTVAPASKKSIRRVQRLCETSSLANSVETLPPRCHQLRTSYTYTDYEQPFCFYTYTMKPDSPLAAAAIVFAFPPLGMVLMCPSLHKM